MFYLINFFKSLLSNPIKGITFIVLTFLFVGSSFYGTKIENSLLKGVSKMEKGASFFALVDSRENNQRIARKLRDLPGVEKVSVLSKSDVSSSLDNLLKTLDVGISKDLLDLSFSGLQIEFQKGLPSRSQNLIRNYLSRLVGTEKLTMGAVNKESIKQKKKRGSIVNFIRIYFGPILTGVMGFSWLVFFLFFRKSILRDAYLAEQYQRRKNVGIKTLSVGFVTLFSISSGIFIILFGKPEIAQILFVMTVLFMVTIVHMKKTEWE